MKSLFLFILILLPYAESRCIKDIYTAGISADSFGYDIKNDQGTNTIASTLGTGVKLGRIFFCPKERIEVITYYRMRHFNLDETKKYNEFSELKSDVFLNSLGADARYLLSSDQEILLDIEIREDYAPTSIDYNNQKFFDDIYMNLKALAGYRHFLKSNNDEDYTASVKLGPLIPLKTSTSVGLLSEFNLEYFRRINKKYSIRADLYYSFYNQSIQGLDISRQELGVRYNYVFRY